MTKHLIGFGLFASILGFFVAAFWIFSSEPKVGTAGVEVPASVDSWSYCDKDRRRRKSDSPGAVADRRNGTITLYLNEIHGAPGRSSSELDARFTFFAVRGDEVRVVDVIPDSLVVSVRPNSGPKWVLQYEASWVKGLSWDENLYVIPSVSEGSTSFKRAPSDFSRDSAMPVLIRN